MDKFAACSDKWVQTSLCCNNRNCRKAFTFSYSHFWWDAIFIFDGKRQDIPVSEFNCVDMTVSSLFWVIAKNHKTKRKLNQNYAE